MLRLLPTRLPSRRLRSTALAVAGVGLAIAASGCAPTGPTGSLGSTPPLTGAYAKNVFGVDVSSYQHPNGTGINWSSVKAGGATFAFVKMSEGASYTNPYATGDLQGARAVGLRASAYHFARPRLPLSTATADAQRFAAQVGNTKAAGALPPVLDIEANGGLSAANVTAWTRTFLSALESATGRTPMIYSGGWFWRGYMGNPAGFARYPVWISDYNPSATGPSLFGDFSYSTFWQYTDAARVSGISGGVDGNWFHGSRSQLDVLAYVGPQAPAVTTPPSATLSITAANSVRPGASLWISGKLLDARTKAPLAGKTFSLWRKTVGQTAFTKVITGKTLSDGTAFYSTTQRRTTTYQFRVDAGAAGTGFPAVSSPQKTVTS
jgi:GH25 family lysozyme M1 (1,4-beta-N-acetylmuramidase)